MNVFVVERDAQLSRMFIQKGYSLAYRLKDADIVCFPGGPDISPELYGSARHPLTSCDPYRDATFSEIYELVRDPKIVKVGVCGGGQFLHVKNGGVMYQHVDGHLGHHEMVYNSNLIDQSNVVGTTFEVTSTHHQMMKQNGWSELWGVADNSTRRELTSHTHTEDSIVMDTEVLYYPDTRCLCFQPHPEYDHSPTNVVFFKALNTVLSKRKAK
jgi:gamma-glutamyl-gamma-aminobutyrate hydrolase PuuD